MNKKYKQKRPDTCLATTLGIIVNESEDYVLDWFKNYGDRPKVLPDSAIFLAHHGFYLVRGLNPIIKKMQNENGDILDIFVTMPLVDNHALMIVKLRHNKNTCHAVYWNGSQILDPWDGEFHELREYDVETIYFITRERELIYK